MLKHLISILSISIVLISCNLEKCSCEKVSTKSFGGKLYRSNNKRIKKNYLLSFISDSTYAQLVRAPSGYDTLYIEKFRLNKEDCSSYSSRGLILGNWNGEQGDVVSMSIKYCNGIFYSGNYMYKEQ